MLKYSVDNLISLPLVHETQLEMYLIITMAFYPYQELLLIVVECMVKLLDQSIWNMLHAVVQRHPC